MEGGLEVNTYNILPVGMATLSVSQQYTVGAGKLTFSKTALQLLLHDASHTNNLLLLHNL